MEIQYKKHYSTNLNREMEYKTYGEKGHPVLVFPSQDGRFYDYQDFDMVGTLGRFALSAWTALTVRHGLT